MFTTSARHVAARYRQAARQHGIGCIVITGDEGKVAGIVSERDIVREIAPAPDRRC